MTDIEPMKPLRAGVYTFPDCAEAGRRLAEALDLSCHVADLHRFPDGESLVRLAQPMATAVLYASFTRPNDRLMEIMFAASVLRESGASRLILVAPYLPYMRQDVAFRPGEAVSQRIVGQWIARQFDHVIAVDPHLHRTDDLAAVFPDCKVTALTAAGLLVDRLRRDHVSSDTVIIGPDEESEPLARGVAEPLGLDWSVARKDRRGDRNVEVVLPSALNLRGRPVVMVDDIISSGGTMLECARAVLEHGAVSVDAITIHALFGDEIFGALRGGGIADVLSCDGVAHPSNRIALSGLIADAVRDLIEA